MSLSEGAHRDIAAWPGNQASLSQAMFGTDQTLRHKLSGHRGMVFGLDDAMQLMQLTKGRETIKALAREVGGVFLQMPAIDIEIGNTELHLAMLRVTERLGALNAEVFKSLADDDQIDAGEQARIDRLRHEICEELLRYVSLLYRVYGNGEVHAIAFASQSK